MSYVELLRMRGRHSWTLQLYLAGYLLTFTYGKTSEADNIVTTIHFTISLLSPVASVVSTVTLASSGSSLTCVSCEPRLCR